MGNRTLKTVLLVLTPLLVLLCGTTFALMLRQTAPLDNQFEAAVVNCTVVESFNGTQKTSIAVKNNAPTDQPPSNIPAYLRVRLVSYWVDSDGNIVSKPSEMPDISVVNGWIKGADNTFYYPDPVDPGASTPNLLGAAIGLEQDPDGYRQVIEVFADAIQSKPAEAVTGSWGVSLSNSKISAVP